MEASKDIQHKQIINYIAVGYWSWHRNIMKEISLKLSLSKKRKSIFSGTCLLSNNVKDYHFVSQGKVSIISDPNNHCLFFTVNIIWFNLYGRCKFYVKVSVLSSILNRKLFVSKVSVESIDDKEDMLFADEAFDILGFSKEEKYNIYKVSDIVIIF